MRVQHNIGTKSDFSKKRAKKKMVTRVTKRRGEVFGPKGFPLSIPHKTPIFSTRHVCLTHKLASSPETSDD